MSKLQAFYVWANRIIQFVPNTPLNRPEHGADTLATKKSGSNALWFLSCGDISETDFLFLHFL
jgi:hypothetical protein